MVVNELHRRLSVVVFDDVRSALFETEHGPGARIPLRPPWQRQDTVVGIEIVDEGDERAHQIETVLADGTRQEAEVVDRHVTGMKTSQHRQAR